MREYPQEVCTAAQVGTISSPPVMNPTLRENVQAKIRWHQEEIARLERVYAMFPPSMLDMNIRDMREALSF